MIEKTRGMGEEVARHGEWIEGHEKRCEERYSAIQSDIGEIRDDLKTATRMLFGLLIAVIGWCAVQLWNGRGAPPAMPIAVAESHGPQRLAS
jgi:hypothetical protein